MDKPPRLHYLDWARGLAALIMLQGHAFHAWVRPELQASDLYQISQMLGGVPAVLFLFLAGISLVIVLDRAERSGDPPARVFFKRSGYLLAMALLFRFQQWLSWWPDAPARDLLKVDILNTIAVALAVAGGTTILVPARWRAAAAAIGALAVAVLTPLVWSAPLGALPGVLAAYLRGGAETFSFPVFPWISYTFTGVAVGLALVGRRDVRDVDRVMQWLVLLALVLITGARFFDSLPYTYYRPYNYWLTSPNLVAIRTAVALLVLAACYGWSRLANLSRPDWICRLGTSSLLVYWVHIELVYGRSLRFLQGQLDLRQAAVGTALLTAAMVALSAARRRWRWSAVAAPWLWGYAGKAVREAPAYVPVRSGADRDGRAA